MRLKWDNELTGKGQEAWSGGYTEYKGDVPPKGLYIVRLKRMTMVQIKSEANKGKPRLNILFEVVGGAGSNGIEDPNYQYLGAPIWDGLNIIKGSEGRAQGFIHALTDGSDAQKKAIENAFWPPNQDIRGEKEKSFDGSREDVHIKSIGKVKIGSPNGQTLLKITTKMGKSLQGEPRAEVAGYLPYINPNAVSNGTASSVADDIVDDAVELDVMDINEFDDDVAVVDDVVEGELVDDEPPF